MKAIPSKTRVRSFAVVCAVVFLPGTLHAAEPVFHEPPLPAIPPRTFSVADFGAKGDGETTNTKAIQAAIDACAKAGGGAVVVPSGVFLSGPVRLANHINLRIEHGATLRMLPLDKYPGGTKEPADFIRGDDLHDIALSGKGAIDGQGSAWWPFAKDKTKSRPRMIKFNGCDRVLIEQLTLMNSPMFHIAVSKSSNITVRGVTIRAPSSKDPKTPSHNTDACDVSGSHILIRDCDVSVGDDNYTCGGGTSDVLITHCTYGRGHGVSIGSYTRGGVSDITVTDCTFKDTQCGIRIKTDRDRGGVLRNLSYRNLRMTNVGCPILIYGAYKATGKEFRDLNKITPEIAAKYPAAPVTGLTPVFRDIVFSNIEATVESGGRAGLIWGVPEAPASNVLLRNVNITADRPFGIFNAHGVRLENCKITTPDGVNRISSVNAQIDFTPH